MKGNTIVILQQDRSRMKGNTIVIQNATITAHSMGHAGPGTIPNRIPLRPSFLLPSEQARSRQRRRQHEPCTDGAHDDVGTAATMFRLVVVDITISLPTASTNVDDAITILDIIRCQRVFLRRDPSDRDRAHGSE